MTEFERIEEMRRAHFERSEASETAASDVSEIEARLYHNPRVEAQGTNYQQCGGGRRVLRKRVGD